MLGVDDEIEMQENPFESIFGGGMFNKMFGGAIKMLEKELEKEFKNQNQNVNHNLPQRTNFEIIINGKRINPENIKLAKSYTAA